MICPKCGSQMDDTDRWCMRCGMINYNAKQSSIIEDQKVESLDFNDNDSSNVVSEVSNINYDDVSYPSSSRVSKILFYVVNAIILLLIISLFFVDANSVIEGGSPLTVFMNRYADFLIKIFTGLLLIVFFYVICYEKIFEKAGKHWWQMLIPIYNVYLIYKISTGDGKLFWTSIAITFILSFLGGMFPDSMENFMNIIEVIISLIIWVILSVGLADRFNANRILMVLFGFVMLPIAAFSKSYTYES